MLVQVAGFRLMAAAVALAVATPAYAKRFAIRCTGTAVRTWSFEGGKESSSQSKVDDLYVIDEEAKTLQRALFPREEYDKLCGEASDASS